MTLEVVALAGFATVQDGGRPGRMHEGVPPGGPLVPELLARANAAAGNDYEEAAIELLGAITLVSDGPAVVATCDGDARRLVGGEPWAAASAGRSGTPRYVAVRGGVDVPRVFGGRGTLVVAGLGGHEGRPLRKGDRLRAGSSTECRLPLPARPDLEAAVQVILGPDLARFSPVAIETLLGSPFAVHTLRDRAGMRLSGPPLERADGDTGISAPMVRGAIQVPASGEAIVLGPDHPTTGGYPVIATVVRSSLGALAARPPGAAVRFVLAP
jgi:biotin-dependent carboxylase-like uncharacterized protein